MEKKKELINYIVFGFLCTLVNWASYSILVEVANLSITISNAIAWLIAIIFAFITNKIFVFHSETSCVKDTVKEAAKFFCSRLASGVVEIFLPTALFCIGINQDLFGIKGFASKIIVSAVVTVMNYVTSKFIVFKNDNMKE